MPKVKHRYLLLRGGHRHGGITYHAKSKNNVVESELDLAKIGGNKKFRKLDGRSGLVEDEEEGSASPTAVPDKMLEQMTKDELIAFAKEEEIDLGTATKKDEILATITAEIDAR